MEILSLDPGKLKLAYAVWDEGGFLLRAGLTVRVAGPGEERVECWRKTAEHFWSNAPLRFEDNAYQFVCEVPQVYTGTQDEDRNDLIDLAGVLGALCVSPFISSVEWSPLPREWKGQIPKEVSQARVEKRLSDAEKALVKWPAKGLKHNVYDALHLGLTYLEREGLREIPLSQKYPG